MKTKFGPRTPGEMIPANFGLGNSHSVIKYKGQADTVTDTVRYNTPSPAPSNGKIMHDIVTSNWLKRQSEGQLVINPMDKTESWAEVITPFDGISYHGFTTMTNPPTGGAIDHVVTETNRLYSDLSAYPPVDLGSLPYVKAEAVNKAFANAHQRNVMGLVDIAEAGKTFDMIRTNLGRVESVVNRGLYKTVGKRLNRMGKNSKVMQYKAKTALGYTADASGLWLETQYGIIPLMLSLNGLVKTLTKPSTNRKLGRTFRGSASLHMSDTYTRDASFDVLGTIVPAKYEVFVSQEMYARAGVITRYSPSVKAMLGLEIRDIIPGAYELIPFSFVLDWAFNLGAYLEAVTPVKGFKSDGSWVTLFNEVVLQYMYTRQSTTVPVDVNMWVREYPSIYSEFVIGYRTAQRIPGVVPIPPQVNTEVQSLTHFISGAALAFSKTINSKPFRKALTR